MKYPAFPKPAAWVRDLSEGSELHLDEPSWGGEPLFTAVHMMQFARGAVAENAPQESAQEPRDWPESEGDAKYWAAEAMRWRKDFLALKYGIVPSPAAHPDTKGEVK